MEILDMQMKEPKRKRTNVTIDMDIVEYMYAANMEDITSDDKLMDLILANGFYKEAFMDAFGMNKIRISHRGVEHIMKGPEKGIHSTLHKLQGKEQVVIYGVTYKNVEMKNINKVYGE